MRVRSMLLKRLPLRRTAIFITTAALFYAVYIFVVPQILRFRFRRGLSWYDLGLHGFGPTRRYVSSNYTSPVVEISEYQSGCDPGLTFLAPRGDSIAHPGPMILDAQGNLVWMKHNLNITQDFKVQRYKGQDYLTYWEGEEIDGRGYGAWYMVCFCPRLLQQDGQVTGFNSSTIHIQNNSKSSQQVASMETCTNL